MRSILLHLLIPDKFCCSVSFKICGGCKNIRKVAGKEKEVRCSTRKFLAKRKEVVLPFKNWPHDATWATPVLVNINYGKFLGIPFFNLFPLL